MKRREFLKALGLLPLMSIPISLSAKAEEVPPPDQGDVGLYFDGRWVAVKGYNIYKGDCFNI